MKILLIQANDTRMMDGSLWAAQRRKYAYAPTTLTTLAALVPEELEAEIEIVDEGVDTVPDVLDADLVGISVATPNAVRAYELAAQARRQGCTVVLGGVHVTLLPDEALAHADAIVRGYAEASWPRLLRDFAAGCLARVYQEPWLERFKAGMPLARRDLLKKHAYMLTHTLEATRGCPNRCSFCVIPTVFEGHYCARQVSDVIREIEAMHAKEIVFLDSSPTDNPRYIRRLYEALAPLHIAWYGSATCRAASDPYWVRLAARSGCRGVLIGFESVAQASLNQANKRFNTAAQFRSMVERLHDHGIGTLGCFIFGLEDDDVSIFERTAELALEARIDLVQYAVLTPFPGTAEFRRLKAEGRILTEDWSQYDGKHVVFQPARMTADRLEEGLREAWQRTYSIESIFRRVRSSPLPLRLSALSNLAFRHFGRTFIPPKETRTLLSRVS